jgi:hypothetical protein
MVGCAVVVGCVPDELRRAGGAVAHLVTIDFNNSQPQPIKPNCYQGINGVQGFLLGPPDVVRLRTASSKQGWIVKPAVLGLDLDCVAHGGLCGGGVRGLPTIWQAPRGPEAEAPEGDLSPR